MRIRMIQQMSGRRADGRVWPPVGGVIDVDEQEARALCHTSTQQSHPIAVLVKEEEAEMADADERSVETAAPVKTSRAQRPEPRPARAVAAEKRG